MYNLRLYNIRRFPLPVFVLLLSYIFLLHMLQTPPYIVIFFSLNSRLFLKILNNNKKIFTFTNLVISSAFHRSRFFLLSTLTKSVSFYSKYEIPPNSYEISPNSYEYIQATVLPCSYLVREIISLLTWN